jgi:class 3 adenylate cyclase/tetratricopeptide (TPR) repeat protein
MLRCSRCGSDNREGRRFCASCGGPLILVCSACGFANETHEKFCGGCGAVLAGSPSAPRAGAYTPRHLAAGILRSRHAMEGEHKQVTVLFCDLVESTRLAEQVTPETMHEIMDRVLKLMAEAIHRYGGTVNQFLGDGVMALFGAPMALEDHALRAVQAALAIRETAAGYGAQLQQQYGVDLRLRIGLNTGPVVVGRIGDDLRMDYTAIGDTTNLAARLQAMAEAGSILVSETTHRGIEGHIHTEPLALVSVKGRSQPVGVARVLGRRRQRSHLEVRAERGLTPVVGRQRELALLQECWARARRGHGLVVGLVGEPGVGKSRLVFEFRNTLVQERIGWFEGHCSALGQTRPYLPILSIVAARLQIEEGDNPLQIEEKLRRGVRQIDEDLETYIPFLREMFNLPGEDQAIRHMDPQLKRRQTFEALRALAVAGARSVPAVVVLEDLHWIDKTSEDYLAFFVESLPSMPVLVITTHRPGYVVRWAERTWYTQLGLDMLGDGDAELLITRLLGSPQVPREALLPILEKAEGNPLALEEITTSLVERGILVRDAGGIRWTGSRDVRFPATIQDVVRARIDRLDEEVKDTLQIASAIGREFRHSLLARIVGAAGALDDHLAALRRLELIHATRLFPEPVSVFKHAVIQDVAYLSLLLPRRRELHAAIAEAIEELYAGHLEEHAAILAHHYQQSERPAEVLRYALVAGERAARLNARAEARTYYDQARAAAEALPASPATRAEGIDVVLRLAAVGLTRSDIERDLVSLEQARVVASELGDELRLARVLYWLGRVHYVSGRTAAAIQYAEQSLAIADRLGDETLAAPSVNLLGRAYSRSALPRAVQMMVRSAEQMQRVGNATEEATARGFAGGLLAIAGDFQRAFAYLDLGVQLAHELKDPFAEAANYFYRGIAHEQHGAPARAIPEYEQALRLAERTGDLFRVYAVKHYQGWACTMAGDVAGGRARLEESVTLAERLGTSFSLGLAKAYFAASLIVDGQLDAAVAICEEAVRLAQGTHETFAEALAQRVLAEALLEHDRPDVPRAERAVVDAIRAQQEIGARPELARSLLTHARVLSARGDEGRATSRFAEALDMFQEMGMTWDIERAQRLQPVSEPPPC